MDRRPSSAEYFAELGARIERAWCDRERDEEALPDLAAEALAAMPPDEHLDVGAMVREFLSPRQQATRQLAPVGVFGQPGVTAYFGRGFVIDVYFWVNCNTAIHNHPFCGLFTVVRGSSLHCTYDFAPDEVLGPRVSLGRLRPREVSLLRAGDVERFSLRRYPLIHTLLHVPVGAVSLVIRTLRAVEYFRYFPPGVALSMTDPDDFVARQLKLLDHLREAADPDYAAALGTFVAAADFESTFRALVAAYPACDSPEDFARLAHPARARHGARIDLLTAAVAQAWRTVQHTALRDGLRDEDQRFVASVLMTAPTRADVRALLRARYGDADQGQRLLDWGDAVGLFEGDEGALRITVRGMIEGVALEEIRARLEAVFSAPVVAERAAALEAYCATSIYAALLRRPAAPPGP